MSQADDDTRKQVEMAGIRQLQDALAAKDAKIERLKGENKKVTQVVHELRGEMMELQGRADWIANENAALRAAGGPLRDQAARYETIDPRNCQLCDPDVGFECDGCIARRLVKNWDAVAGKEPNDEP